MNPEEGELRPQLLGRFGLCVEVSSSDNLDHRNSVLKGRQGFDMDLVSFGERWREENVPAPVIDSEEGLITLDIAKKLAKSMNAKYLKLEELRSDTVLNATRNSLS